MHMAASSNHSKTIEQRKRSVHRPAAISTIQKEWEAFPPNDRDHYVKSPICKHLKGSGAFSPDHHMTRTFNRKMKMKDTFTQIFPSYDHKKETCYLNGKVKSFSHQQHPRYHETIESIPLSKIDKRNNRKMDKMKDYSEQMYKLGSFAPQPIKAPKAR